MRRSSYSLPFSRLFRVLAAEYLALSMPILSAPSLWLGRVLNVFDIIDSRPSFLTSARDTPVYLVSQGQIDCLQGGILRFQLHDEMFARP